MAHVIAHTHIKRDNKKHIYYVKAGAIWQAPRRGSKGGRKKKVVQFAAAKRMDYSRSIYFVDRSGNVAAARRRNSTGKRRKSGGRRR